MDQIHDFETVPCPLCSGTAFTVVYPGTFPSALSREFLTEVYRSSSDQTLFEQVVKCAKCGLVYLNPRLNSALIVDSYAEGEDMAFVEQDAMRIRTFSAALKRLGRRHGVVLSDRTNVLDIGCAGGAFLQAARTLGLSAVGLEPSKWLSGYARTKHGLDVRTGTLADHSFPEAHFDLVTLWDVIEHVPDPGAELKEVHRILKPGGLLVVNYPDFGSVAAKLLGKRWPFLLSVHLVYYTRRTMRRQLLKAGFKAIEIRMHWQTLEFGYVLKRASRYFPFIRFFGHIVEKLGLASLPLKYWIGQTQVVAKRC
jgi:2-polyprenyl-3-methyl-5-hydroxy-6-metoxy-1,4-benzoquinol methylase